MPPGPVLRAGAGCKAFVVSFQLFGPGLGKVFGNFIEIGGGEIVETPNERGEVLAGAHARLQGGEEFVRGLRGGSESGADEK